MGESRCLHKEYSLALYISSLSSWDPEDREIRIKLHNLVFKFRFEVSVIQNLTSIKNNQK